eukprot:g2783.t1
MLNFSNPPPEHDEPLEFKICEKHTKFCIEMPRQAILDGEVIEAFSETYQNMLPNTVAPYSSLQFNQSLFDGEWHLRFFGGISYGVAGYIDAHVYDEEETLRLNASAWSDDANQQERRFRAKPRKVYETTRVVSLEACAPSGGVTQYVCSNWHDASLCSSGAAPTCDRSDSCPDSWLGDGSCDLECNTASCAYDNEDCCVPPATNSSSHAFKITTWTEEKDFGTVNVFGSVTEKDNDIYIGREGANKLLGGVLFYQERRVSRPCTEISPEEGGFSMASALLGSKPYDRFKDIHNMCSEGASTEPYGFDPQYMESSSLYSAEAVEEKQGLYTAEEKSSGDFFASNGVPYAFRYAELESGKGGYPLYFDVNMPEHEKYPSTDDYVTNRPSAKNYVTYLRDAGWIDAETSHITSQLLTYNVAEGMFCSMVINFEFSRSGQISLEYELQSVQLEPYRFDKDIMRGCLELVLILCIIANIITEAWELFANFDIHHPAEYFESMWNYLDLLNLTLLTSSVVSWAIFNFFQAKDFEPFHALRMYDPVNLENDPETVARWFKIIGENAQRIFKSGVDARALANWQFNYLMVNGTSVIIMLFRTLNMFDFQPRVGLVTRTLERAAGDLFHFIVVFLLVIFGYSVVGYLNFGHSIEAFSTMSSSVVTCFEILLGEIGVNEELREKQTISRVLWFWSYILLAFFILINILLAIIIDAYVEVKKEAERATPLPKELWQLMLCRLGGSCSCDAQRKRLETEVKARNKWMQLAGITKAEGDSLTRRMRRRRRGRQRKVVFEIDEQNMFDVDQLSEVFVRGMYDDHKKAKKAQDLGKISHDLLHHGGLKRVSTIKPKLPSLKDPRETKHRANENAMAILRYYGSTIIVQRDRRGRVSIIHETPEAAKKEAVGDEKV